MRMDGRTDRQTDMTKLIVAVRNFAKARVNDVSLPEYYVDTLDTLRRYIRYIM